VKFLQFGRTSAIVTSPITPALPVDGFAHATGVSPRLARPTASAIIELSRDANCGGVAEVTSDVLSGSVVEHDAAHKAMAGSVSAIVQRSTMQILPQNVDFDVICIVPEPTLNCKPWLRH